MVALDFFELVLELVRHDSTKNVHDLIPDLRYLAQYPSIQSQTF
jgi:hypothetical protein